MPTDQDINEHFTNASQEFLRLFRKKSISASDLEALPMIERFVIASELWPRCEYSARRSLVRDSHPAVQAEALAKTARAPFRHHKDTSHEYKSAL